jgi:hypothetical protein
MTDSIGWMDGWIGGLISQTTNAVLVQSEAMPEDTPKVKGINFDRFELNQT